MFLLYFVATRLVSFVVYWYWQSTKQFFYPLNKMRVLEFSFSHVSSGRTLTCCLVSGRWTDLDARPWDFQAEECALRASIERFNSRRYDKSQSNPDFLPVDNCLQSVLGQRVDLPEDFQMNYDLWLEREVFSKPISWEELLQWENKHLRTTYSLWSKFILSITIWWTDFLLCRRLWGFRPIL